MNLTLRIKRVYFDAILNGEKHVEYRDGKPFYEKLLRGKKFKTLTLHYQMRRKLICDVRAIHHIDTPEFFAVEDDGIPFGRKTFAIHVTNARLIRE